MNLSTSSGVESQAAKRQKLEDGHLRKVCKFLYSPSSEFIILEETAFIFVSLQYILEIDHKVDYEMQ